MNGEVYMGMVTLEQIKDPTVFAKNRLKAHSDHCFFANEKEVAAGKSSFRLGLNGVWKFYYAKNFAQAPQDFYIQALPSSHQVPDFPLPNLHLKWSEFLKP